MKLADGAVPWEHEVYAKEGIPAATATALTASVPGLQRGSILDDECVWRVVDAVPAHMVTLRWSWCS